MILHRHKLLCLMMLVSTNVIFFSGFVNISSGQDTLTKIDISGATLEGKYLIGSIQGDNPAWNLLVPRIALYRANSQKESITINAKVNGNVPGLAESQGNAPISINIGSLGYLALVCYGYGCGIESPQHSQGTLSQRPEVSGHFEWDNTKTDTGYSKMYFAIIPLAEGGLKSSNPPGPVTITAYIVILPHEPTFEIESGYAGSGKGDPKLLHMGWMSAKDLIGIRVEGLNPFAVVKSIELDGQPLTEVPYQDNVDLMTPGTWMMDRSSPNIINLGSENRGFLFSDVDGFLRANLPNAGGYIRFPENFHTGYHDLTFVAEPFKSGLGESVGGINPDSYLFGITGNEGQKLTAKFLLFNPTFTLDKNRLSPGDAFTVIGSGFAPVTRVKIYAVYGTEEVSLGDAATDASGGFNVQLNLSPSDIDWFNPASSQYMWIASREDKDGYIRVKIDNPVFKDHYSSAPDVVKGLEKDITYVKPGTTQVSPPSQSAPSSQGAIGSSVPTTSGTPGNNPSPLGNTVGPNGNINPPAVLILDHSMASQMDEIAAQPITIADTFYPSTSNIYSWLKFGKIDDAHLVEWKWYSPDGSLYNSNANQIPKPAGSPWESYNVYSSISIAGYSAANMPGNWHVDVFIDGKKILTEQFALSVPGAIQSPPASSVAPQIEYPDLSGTWYMGGPRNEGLPCQILLSGNALIFINEKGEQSAGPNNFRVCCPPARNDYAAYPSQSWGRRPGNAQSH